MRRGFGYIYFLILAGTLCLVIAGLSKSLINLHLERSQDLKQLQAYYLADSARAWYPNLTLPNNNLASLTNEKLINAPGFTWTKDQLGCKIVKNKNIVYFLGFTGGLQGPKSLSILALAEGKITPWQE